MSNLKLIESANLAFCKMSVFEETHHINEDGQESFRVGDKFIAIMPDGDLVDQTLEGVIEYKLRRLGLTYMARHFIKSYTYFDPITEKHPAEEWEMSRPSISLRNPFSAPQKERKEEPKPFWARIKGRRS